MVDKNKTNAANEDTLASREQAAQKERQERADTQKSQRQEKQPEGPKLPEKRATVRHTDTGYSIASVDGQELPNEQRFQGLAGLFEQVASLQKAGYVVSVEDGERREVELDGMKAKKA